MTTNTGAGSVHSTAAHRDLEYVHGLNPSEADYLGHDHEQLKSFVETNLDARQVADVSTAYLDLHKAFEDFATQMNEAVAKSKGSWEGEAATNAQAYFGSLGKWADVNSQNAKLASETIGDQGTAAQNAKNAMTEPVPFNWDEEFDSWATANPLTMGDTIDKSLQKQQDSRSAHEQAAETMSGYDKSLYAAASKQPVFAEPPKFGVSGSAKPDVVLPSGNVSVDQHHGTGGDTGSSVSIPGGGAAAGHAAATASGPGQMTGSGHLPVADGTTTASAAPAAGQQQGGNQGGSSAAGMGAMPMGGMGGGGGFGGESEHETKVGRGGGSFGPGQGVSETNPGAGSGGAARPGGMGAAEAAAGRGMGGAPGRPGGMGAADWRSEGDDDRDGSAFLEESDPDDLFGSGLRSAPPVIGE
ncbi:hypothetical protein [Amycolatopsis saalfeldensis]|uniref:PPE family protein n=1 Tax=Amycolatopsis saalfeldensis TaxID=394193 RepID=A0A1H8YBW6_9PSEU|nr:hypothetical protein [Amycolatopsis saalfeldensis]SEP49639.1 hypothetical protein SAMN04489732_113131 [Amycolatopsis saalfeldensis]